MVSYRIYLRCVFKYFDRHTFNCIRGHWGRVSFLLELQQCKDRRGTLKKYRLFTLTNAVIKFLKMCRSNLLSIKCRNAVLFN